MSVEVEENELVQVSTDTGGQENNSCLHDQENGKLQGQGFDESIKFDSHAPDQLVKGEANNVHETSFPKDAVDEWPVPKQIHSFYFIKYRSYEDPKLKVQLEQADKELQNKITARTQIVDKLRECRSDRAEVITQMKPLSIENQQFRTILDAKRKEMEPLHQALNKFRSASNAARERAVGLCSSEEELNDLIKMLEYRIQHESMPLSEEKQLIREIKQLEGSRERVIANAAMKAKIQESRAEQEAIQDQVKLMGVNFDGVKREHQVVKFKHSRLKEEKEAIEKDIKSLEDELAVTTRKREEAKIYFQKLKLQRDEQNVCYYQNRTLLNKAKALAAKRDTEALKTFSVTEVENFMSLWSSNKDFRDDYEKRIMLSLDIRQLSRDGRIRNPDEKPLVLFEPAIPSETEILPKPSEKQPKETSISLPQQGSSSNQKAQKEENSKLQKKAKNKATGSGATLEPIDLEEPGKTSALEKPQKDPAKENEVDITKLKERKREEEMAKAKQALERKKKLAEKAAAKAAKKALKEAEKKLKEREKRAKKKAAASAPEPAPEEEAVVQADAEVTEPKDINEHVEPLVPPKNKERKENTIRHKSRPKGPVSLSKIILKRKRSTNYWMWAAPTAILTVLMLLVIGYNYVL